MSTFFLEIYDEARRGDGLAIFMCFIFGVLGAFILFALFYFADSSFLPERKEAGTVVSRHYSPPHTTFITSTVNGVTSTTPVYHPASWSSEVLLDDFGITERVSCPILESQYNAISREDETTTRLVTGRFTSSTYCKGIE